ncbi:hypothetical protein LINPERPRIM_LOCUS41161 [Linum perenne]
MATSPTEQNPPPTSRNTSSLTSSSHTMLSNRN